MTVPASPGSAGSDLTVGSGRPFPAADQPVGAIVATHGEAFRKYEPSGPRPWRSAERFVSDGTIDEYLASGAELLRGKVAQ